MRICCISDTHGLHRKVELPEADVLVHAGDITGRGSARELEEFNQWCGEIKNRYKRIIVVGGNHDFMLEKFLPRNPHGFTISQTRQRELTSNFTYLRDSGITVEGVKFYGSPWQPRYFDWAFNIDRGSEELRRIWARIPDDTNVLITHSPAHGILDKTKRGDLAGCELLRERIDNLKQLRLHMTGHIHEANGIYLRDDVTFVNASICTLDYQPSNIPYVITV